MTWLVLLAVGTLLGAMTGALIGQKTESGFIRGAAVGAMSGAIFSIEVFECSIDLWHCDNSGIGCLLYLVSHMVLFRRDTMSTRNKPSTINSNFKKKNREFGLGT